MHLFLHVAHVQVDLTIRYWFTWALHIHKVRVRRLDKSFLLMLSSLMVNSRVEEVFSQLE